MRELKLLCATHGLVASALAMGLLFAASYQGWARTGADPGVGPIRGMARVIDGDTIDVGDTRIRLEGIDAPETGQTCKRRWLASWPCGHEATAALQRLIENRVVGCDPRGFDKYGRTLAICYVDGRDINAHMVRQGHAWAFVKYSQTYVKEEAAARAEGLGIWQSPSEPAWDYRAKRWSAAEQKAPEGCAIKGNVTKNGKIYHMPWSPWYAQIRIDAEKGKRWFCSEAEAIAAGWRPVQVH
jgi:endonuclease YncB( thermonuclease family)